jgi:hypothetical protein
LRVWGRGEACTGVWWGNLKDKRPLGRPRLRWDNNNKMDLQEVGCGGMDWIDVAGTCDCGLEPSDSIK